MASLKEKIRSSQDRPTLEVPVPEWECSVKICTWSGADRARFFKWIKANENGPGWDNLYALVAVWSVVEDDGKPMFTEADVPWLSEKSSKALERIATSALTHNGVGVDSIEAAKKNSAPTPK